MTFQWRKGEVSCLRRTVLGRDINVDAFSARDSAIDNSYPSKSYHSHAGSQWVFLQVEVRSNMECLMLLKSEDFFSLCERHPGKHTCVESWRWNA